MSNFPTDPTQWHSHGAQLNYGYTAPLAHNQVVFGNTPRDIASRSIAPEAGRGGGSPAIAPSVNRLAPNGSCSPSEIQPRIQRMNPEELDIAYRQERQRRRLLDRHRRQNLRSEGLQRRTSHVQPSDSQTTTLAIRGNAKEQPGGVEQRQGRTLHLHGSLSNAHIPHMYNGSESQNSYTDGQNVIEQPQCLSFPGLRIAPEDGVFSGTQGNASRPNMPTSALEASDQLCSPSSEPATHTDKNWAPSSSNPVRASRCYSEGQHDLASLSFPQDSRTQTSHSQRPTSHQAYSSVHDGAQGAPYNLLSPPPQPQQRQPSYPGNHYQVEDQQTDFDATQSFSPPATFGSQHRSPSAQWPQETRSPYPDMDMQNLDPSLRDNGPHPFDSPMDTMPTGSNFHHGTFAGFGTQRPRPMPQPQERQLTRPPGPVPIFPTLVPLLTARTPRHPNPFPFYLVGRHRAPGYPTVSIPNLNPNNPFAQNTEGQGQRGAEAGPNSAGFYSPQAQNTGPHAQREAGAQAAPEALYSSYAQNTEAHAQREAEAFYNPYAAQNTDGQGQREAEARPSAPAPFDPYTQHPQREAQAQTAPEAFYHVDAQRAQSEAQAQAQSEALFNKLLDDIAAPAQNDAEAGSQAPLDGFYGTYPENADADAQREAEAILQGALGQFNGHQGAEASMQTNPAPAPAPATDAASEGSFNDSAYGRSLQASNSNSTWENDPFFLDVGSGQEQEGDEFLLLQQGMQTPDAMEERPAGGLERMDF
ncbi:uncharacterized protein BDZ99DRAFT_524132 [Mytilinidion resinicola]|uniref:Uncharacterized protein n=1 Tax=Mytilinidion resinicola TaxID=574789 RepID=A0A6A6YBD3_9PEZI|nr:uncharacterized protein BDZ99DRAFT_524132 [Mytilinidion resinicola]KAF2805888.1 hypothetical protein BDZ99DRAFT_524132 [Mytilinidion resinicola]